MFNVYFATTFVIWLNILVLSHCLDSGHEENVSFPSSIYLDGPLLPEQAFLLLARVSCGLLFLSSGNEKCWILFWLDIASDSCHIINKQNAVLQICRQI